MSNRDPLARYKDDLSQLLDFHTRQWLKGNVHTSIPGVVREYDSATKRARVQIGLNILLTDGAGSMPRPVILDVPVLQPSAGGILEHFPVAPGDGVHLLFSERGIDAFKATYDIADPTLGKLFDESDAGCHHRLRQVDGNAPNRYRVGGADGRWQRTYHHGSRECRYRGRRR